MRSQSDNFCTIGSIALGHCWCKHPNAANNNFRNQDNCRYFIEVDEDDLCQYFNRDIKVFRECTCEEAIADAYITDALVKL